MEWHTLSKSLVIIGCAVALFYDFVVFLPTFELYIREWMDYYYVLPRDIIYYLVSMKFIWDFLPDITNLGIACIDLIIEKFLFKTSTNGGIVYGYERRDRIDRITRAIDKIALASRFFASIIIWVSIFERAILWYYQLTPYIPFGVISASPLLLIALVIKLQELIVQIVYA